MNFFPFARLLGIKVLIIADRIVDKRTNVVRDANIENQRLVKTRGATHLFRREGGIYNLRGLF